MKTKAEWHALSKTIVLRNLAYIDGRFQRASSGETFPSINPATEQLLADVASRDKADVDLRGGGEEIIYFRSWSHKSPGERKSASATGGSDGAAQR